MKHHGRNRCPGRFTPTSATTRTWRSAPRPGYSLPILADQLALGDDASQAARTWLEPVTVLAAVAAVTNRIGLIATASTTYTEPFNLARQFGSLITSAMAVWLDIVTSWLATAARNFGGAGQVSHANRYAQGEEFMTVVKGLWDSWAEDAVVDNRAGGLYAESGTHSPDQSQGRALPSRRTIKPAAHPARPAGFGAGRILRCWSPLCCASRRGGVHRPYGEGDGAGVLRRPEGARGGRPEGRKPEQVLILPGLESDDSLHSGRSRTQGARDQRALIRRSGASAYRAGSADMIFRVSPLDRPLEPEDFPDPGDRGGRSQPYRGDPKSGTA